MIEFIISQFPKTFLNNIAYSAALIALSSISTVFVIWMIKKFSNQDYVDDGQAPRVIELGEAISPITLEKYMSDLSYKPANCRFQFVMSNLFNGPPKNSIWTCGRWTSSDSKAFSEQITKKQRSSFNTPIKAVLKQHYGYTKKFIIENVAAHTREGWFVLTVLLKKNKKLIFVGHELLTTKQRKAIREALMDCHNHFNYVG